MYWVFLLAPSIHTAATPRNENHSLGKEILFSLQLNNGFLSLFSLSWSCPSTWQRFQVYSASTQQILTTSKQNQQLSPTVAIQSSASHLTYSLWKDPFKVQFEINISYIVRPNLVITPLKVNILWWFQMSILKVIWLVEKYALSFICCTTIEIQII